MRILIKILYPIWWVLESQWWVVREHKAGLEKCKEAGSPTAAAVLVWAPLMCFPQWVIAPAFWSSLANPVHFFCPNDGHVYCSEVG